MARGEKKIDTWQLEIDGQPVTVALYMTTGRDAIEFYARCKKPIALTLSGAEINELKAETEAELKKQFRTDWRNMLLVRVTGAKARLINANPPAAGTFRQEKERTEVEVNIDTVQIAEPASGKVHRFSTHGYLEEQSPNRMGWPDTGEIRHPHGGQPAMVALIPDTEANRLALNRILTAMDTLRQELGLLLSPEKIEASLTKVLAAPRPLTIGHNPDGGTSP